MALFVPLPGNAKLAADLARMTGGAVGEMDVRRFPDGESYLRVRTGVAAEDVVLVCTLARPDEKILPLVFAARALRDLGAASVRLVAPYLPYLRQDQVFQPGEALTSRYFAQLLSEAIDGLVTVDPHLHRYAGLDAVYDVPATVVHAAPLLAAWIAANIERPLIVGPDAESEQWVEEIAGLAGAPHAIFAKQRLGDREVRLSVPELARWRGFSPVLVDDIIASATTLCEAASVLRAAGFGRPACLAVHALFGEGAAARLAKVASQVATTDTVPHPSNRFAIAPLLASAVAEWDGSDVENPLSGAASVRRE